MVSKVLQAVLTLVFVLAFNFFLFRGLGDPLQQLLHGHAQLSDAAIAKLRQELGLSLPLPQQFVHYLGETLRGHLGVAFDGSSVLSDITSRIWATTLLIGFSTLASVALGVWIGIA